VNLKIVVVAGLSGAGRSTAGAAFEDAGWFVVDNLPLALVSKIVELGSQGSMDQLVLVVGRPFGDDYRALVDVIGELRSAPAEVKVIFLDASDEVLVARYEGTKRRHPIPAEGIVSAVKKERSSMEAVKAIADVVIDTSEMSVHELKSRVLGVVEGEPDASRLQVLITSFGFKHGIPLDADLVLDVRFLPNPYWKSELRAKVGLDPKVRDYVLGSQDAQPFLDKIWDLLEFLLPRFVAEGKSYLNLAIGCTGGKHRSVVVTEEIAFKIAQAGYSVNTHHRDMGRD
jgi:UPF0042 nucleotide-binding protein